VTTRVLIVDDHPVFRDGLAALVSSIDDLVVAGVAADGEAALAVVGELAADVVLMDLNLPGISGVDATARLVATPDPPAVLVVTMVDDDDTVVAAMRAGARGYVLKDMDDDDITRAILAVGSGDAIFSPAIAARMMTFFSTSSPQPIPMFPELTESERNVLRLMAKGVNNDTIAQQLALSPKTVRNYISNIFSKLQVADRAQAIVRAHDAGLA